MSTIFDAIPIGLAAVLACGTAVSAEFSPRLSGRVTDPSGAPMPRLQLSVFPFGPSPAESRTDADGRYSFAWNPSRSAPADAAFCILARDSARNLAVAVDIEEGATNLDLCLQPALVITGQVQDSKTNTVAGVVVAAALWTGTVESQFGSKGRTDADGRFTVSGLPPGRRYTIRLTAKNLGLRSQVIEPEFSRTNRLELPPFVFQLPENTLAGQVLDETDRPATNLQVTAQGENQFFASARTDVQGRFAFGAVCDGRVRVLASRQQAYASVTADAGDTNVLLRLSTRPLPATGKVPPPTSLQGAQLPNLAGLGLGVDLVPTNQPVLLCLFDVEQRPSRRFLTLLAERHAGLKAGGVTVIGLQAVVIGAEPFREWSSAAPVPFPVGRLKDKSAEFKWISDVESFPWLILADKHHRIVAQGFALDELEAKLGGLTP